MIKSHRVRSTQFWDELAPAWSRKMLKRWHHPFSNMFKQFLCKLRPSWPLGAHSHPPGPMGICSKQWQFLGQVGRDLFLFPKTLGSGLDIPRSPGGWIWLMRIGFPNGRDLMRFWNIYDIYGLFMDYFIYFTSKQHLSCIPGGNPAGCAEQLL